MSAREQLILDVWTGTRKDSVGAAELDLIQQALVERFGAEACESPASIARILADHGARLEHPQILETDLRWRERELLFTSEELNFATLEAAATWVEKIGSLHQQFQSAQNHLAIEQLRKLILQIKTELELVAASPRIRTEERQLATEVAHWLVIWLQNPQIFADWLDLRRASDEFRRQFEPQRGT